MPIKITTMPEQIFIEAYMRWQSEHEGGDIAGKPYFEGGCDALIMLAQMFGASDEWIQKELMGGSD
jgi:hypothetical protein